MLTQILFIHRLIELSSRICRSLWWYCLFAVSDNGGNNLRSIFHVLLQSGKAVTNKVVKQLPKTRNQKQQDDDYVTSEESDAD